MGEFGNQPATGGQAVQQAGGGTPGAPPGRGGGTSAHPGTGTGTEPAPTQPQGGGGGSQADQERDESGSSRRYGDFDPEWNNLTFDELIEKANGLDGSADAYEEQGFPGAAEAERALADEIRRVAGEKHGQAPDPGEGNSPSGQRPSGSLMDEEGRTLADWNVTDDGTKVTQRYDPETGEQVSEEHRFPEQQADFGSVTNPDGTETDSTQWASGQLLNQTYDAEGNLISSEVKEPGER